MENESETHLAVGFIYVNTFLKRIQVKSIWNYKYLCNCQKKTNIIMIGSGQSKIHGFFHSAMKNTILHLIFPSHEGYASWVLKE